MENADNFNINEIKEFYAMLNVEVSEIGNIIKEIVKLKNSDDYIPVAKKEPYDIFDKILVNHINDTVSKIISEAHIVNCDIVEEALNTLEFKDLNIKKDLFEYYTYKYNELLELMKIDIKDFSSIKSNSNEIYLRLNKIIRQDVFDGKTTSISTEKQVININAISSYVFYKCKFLIPIKRVKNDN